MHNQLFEAALGVTEPWHVEEVRFDAGDKRLTIVIDFTAGRRFGHPDAPGARHPDQALPASELLPVRMLPGSPRAPCPAARWARRTGEAGLGRSARGLHLAVRGAGVGVVPADALCRRRAHGGRILAPGACDLLTLRRAGRGRSGPVGHQRAGHRRNVLPAWPSLPDPGRRCLPTQGGLRHRGQGCRHRRAVRRIPDGASRNTRTDTVGQHRHVTGLHQGRQRVPAQRPHHLRQVPRHRPPTPRPPWTKPVVSSKRPTLA